MLEGRSEVILVGEYAGNGRSGSSAGWARQSSVGLGCFARIGGAKIVVGRYDSRVLKYSGAKVSLGVSGERGCERG